MEPSSYCLFVRNEYLCCSSPYVLPYQDPLWFHRGPTSPLIQFGRTHIPLVSAATSRFVEGDNIECHAIQPGIASACHAITQFRQTRTTSHLEIQHISTTVLLAVTMATTRRAPEYVSRAIISFLHAQITADQAPLLICHFARGRALRIFMQMAWRASHCQRAVPPANAHTHR